MAEQAAGNALMIRECALLNSRHRLSRAISGQTRAGSESGKDF